MFDFEKLDVYALAKQTHLETIRFLKSRPVIDTATRNQLRRASLSIVLNIAEGSGKFSHADKRNYYTCSRGSTYECVAIFDVLRAEDLVSEIEYKDKYARYESLSKMLFGLIQSQK
ncbi:MAG: four helix bundle protein [Patescibacteria group bacterium]